MEIPATIVEESETDSEKESVQISNDVPVNEFLSNVVNYGASTSINKWTLRRSVCNLGQSKKIFCLQFAEMQTCRHKLLFKKSK